ncbi:hypothetical protein PFISCL1PPCAC_10704, partial [Pristionchus fissidentatus]
SISIVTFSFFFFCFKYSLLDSNIVQFDRKAESYGDFCVRPREFTAKEHDYNRVALILHSSADFVSDEFEDQVN